MAVTHGPTSASTAARANGASSSEPIYVAREEPSEIPIIGFNTQGKIDNVDYRKFMRDFDIYHHKGGRYSMVECLATDDQTILFGLHRANRDPSFAQQVNKYKDNKVFDSVMRQMLVESKADYGAQMRATKMLKLTPEGKGTILTLNLYLESINVLIHDGLLDYLDDKEAYRIFMTNLRCEPVVQYIQSRLNKDVDKTKKLKNAIGVTYDLIDVLRAHYSVANILQSILNLTLPKASIPRTGPGAAPQPPSAHIGKTAAATPITKTLPVGVSGEDFTLLKSLMQNKRQPTETQKYGVRKAINNSCFKCGGQHRTNTCKRETNDAGTAIRQFWLDNFRSTPTIKPMGAMQPTPLEGKKTVSKARSLMSLKVTCPTAPQASQTCNMLFDSGNLLDYTIISKSKADQFIAAGAEIVPIDATGVPALGSHEDAYVLDQAIGIVVELPTSPPVSFEILAAIVPNNNAPDVIVNELDMDKYSLYSYLENKTLWNATSPVTPAPEEEELGHYIVSPPMLGAVMSLASPTTRDPDNNNLEPDSTMLADDSFMAPIIKRDGSLVNPDMPNVENIWNLLEENGNLFIDSLPTDAAG